MSIAAMGGPRPSSLRLEFLPWLTRFPTAVHRGRLVVIDLPQVVDVVGNPQGPEFLARDVRRIAEWFTARGLPDPVGHPDVRLLADLRIELGIPV